KLIRKPNSFVHNRLSLLPKLPSKASTNLGAPQLRGPNGANDEFLLAATAQNLRKLAKIFPAPQQMRKA
ncbi:hypothetical protein, partial [Celeribacter halophilus]|uniref:hypothetical protein n=1 Tax=Celeribacter halophilus TaxID=576117 RepID=UPI002FD17B6E